MASIQLVGYLACNPLVSQFDKDAHRVQMVVKIQDTTLVAQEYVTWLETRNQAIFADLCKGLPVKVEVSRVVEWDGTSVFTDQKTGDTLPILKTRGFNGVIEILEKNHQAAQTQDTDKIRRYAGLMGLSGQVQQAADLIAQAFGAKVPAGK